MGRLRSAAALAVLVSASLPMVASAQDATTTVPPTTVPPTTVPPTAETVPPPPADIPPPGPPPLLSGATIPDPTLQPGVVEVPLRGRAYEQAVAAYDASIADLLATQTARVAAEADLAARVAERDAVRQTLISNRAVRRQDAAGLTEAERAVRAMAVASFMSQGTDDDPSIYLLAEGLPEPERRRQLSTEAVAVQIQDREESIATFAASDAVIVTDEETLAARSLAVIEATDALENLDQHIVELYGTLLAQADEIVRVRRAATVSGTDFTLTVLDAYVSAANHVAAEDPGCGLQWWMLAGIGRVESRHGTIRGGTVQPDGRITTRIIGIPLDGNNGTRLITDTDGGTLDGDTAFDRAVGPMQFIPTTWASWGRDGNDDGREDPQNLYDAATAAGVYLCDGQDVGAAGGLAAAYFEYNNSEAYVAAVSGYAEQYRRAVDVPAG